MSRRSHALYFGVLRRYWPLLLFALIPLIPLWRAVFLGEAIGPFDQIRQMGPWFAPAPNQPWDAVQADGVLQFHVWRDLVFDAWSKGQMAFWNPYQLAGTPLLANSQSAVFYPPHILLGILHIPTDVAISLLAWFHLGWAGLGTFLLTRRLGGSRLGAGVSGISFSLSAFMLAWTALPSVISTVSWIPWILAGIVVLFRKGATIFRACGLALSVGMLFLAGHLQFVAYGLFAALLFGLWLAVEQFFMKAGSETRKRSVFPVLACLASAIFGFGLAAHQVMPVLDYSQFSHRRNTPTEEGYNAYVDGAIQPFELATVPLATLEGNPRECAPIPSQKISAYWPQLVHRGANFAESAVAIGPLCLALLFLAPWRRRDVLLPGCLGLIALLLATGTPLNRLLYFFVPGWSSSGSPGRIAVLFVLAASVVAGQAIGSLPKLPAKGLVRLAPFLLPLLATLPFLALANNAQTIPAQQEALHSLVSATILQNGLGLLAAVAVSFLAITALYHPERPDSKYIVLSAPVVIALAGTAFSLIPTGRPLSPAVGPQAHERIAAINKAWAISSAAPALLPPNTATQSRIHDLGGYDSLIHRDSVEMLRDVDGGDPAADANGNMMFVKPKADPAKLASAGVTEVWSLKEIPSLGQPVFRNGFLKYRLPGPGRVSTPQGSGTIETETYQSIRLTATGPGRLVLRDRFMPGWFADVDGKPAPLLGTTWRELELKAGRHTIDMNYVPPGFMSGVLIAMLSWVLLFTLLLLAVATRNRPLPIGETGASEGLQ